MTTLFDESLSVRSSFRTGGSADILLIPESEEELVAALEEYKYKNKKSVVVLGNITNTLITDRGVRGCVILTAGLKEIALSGNIITAQSGVDMSRLAGFALENSLTGGEFLYGIPGTVGGGVVMNAGAYGGEIKDIVESVKLYSPEKGIFTLKRGEMGFGHRKSVVSDSNLVVLSSAFTLEKGDKEAIKAKMDDYMATRRAKQPLEYPSCGSVFKRPAGLFAGKLIEDCGLKGFSVGGAKVSEKHAGFIINAASATSSDMLKIIKHIKETVFAKTGVVLEEEIKIIGE